MTKTHNLKCWPDSFAAIKRGEKDFETRLNDRNYEVGDTMVLMEFVPLEGASSITSHPSGRFTGEKLKRAIKYVRSDSPGLAPGYVILGLMLDLTPTVNSPLHKEMIDMLFKGGPIGDVAQQVIDKVRATDAGGSAPGISGASGGSIDVRVPRRPWRDNDDVAETLAADVDHLTKPRGIPPDVYWSEYGQAFYSQITGRNCGDEFTSRWHDRCSEFPQVRGPHTQEDASRTEPVERFVEEKLPDGEIRQSLINVRKLTDHQRELLYILSEECIEVAIQCSKLLRFGRIATDKSVTPNVSYDNIAMLGLECGHVQHMINVVQACELVFPFSVKAGDAEKGEKLRRYLQTKADPVNESFVHEGQS